MNAHVISSEATKTFISNARRLLWAIVTSLVILIVVFCWVAVMALGNATKHDQVREAMLRCNLQLERIETDLDEVFTRLEKVEP